VANQLLTSAEAATEVADQPSVHDLTTAMPAGDFLWAIVGMMGAVIIWFIVRDRNSIAAQLKELNTKFDRFMEYISENCVTRQELSRVERKIDHHVDQSTLRSVERRSIEDAEA